MLYSSTDLLNWKNLGAQSNITGLWRPKIATPNNQFWVARLRLEFLSVLLR